MDRINAPELLTIPDGTRIASWIEFAAFADNLEAVRAHPDSIKWQDIVRVKDDDTHVIVTTSKGEFAVDKRLYVVIDTGTPGAVR